MSAMIAAIRSILLRDLKWRELIATSIAKITNGQTKNETSCQVDSWFVLGLRGFGDRRQIGGV